MVIVHSDTCDLCGTCVGVCPFDAIELTETQLSIMHSRCTLCNRCIEICPVEALSMKPEPASLVKP